jgi:hypothetical protein
VNTFLYIQTCEYFEISVKSRPLHNYVAYVITIQAWPVCFIQALKFQLCFIFVLMYILYVPTYVSNFLCMYYPVRFQTHDYTSPYKCGYHCHQKQVSLLSLFLLVELTMVQLCFITKVFLEDVNFIITTISEFLRKTAQAKTSFYCA